MKDALSDSQIEAILKALEDAIEQGPWEESNFLRVIGKNLRDIRDNFVKQIDPSQEKGKAGSLQANRLAPRSGEQEVFISIYSSEGSNMQAWERILVNLPRQVISRPIYADEESAQQVIKSKENKVNEAYVSVYINTVDILPLPPDKTPVDKLGKPLLSLKDRSISLENINRFVHLSGIYRYVKGRLIKNT